MKKVTRINPYMFNLLIEREMDNFSVIEARDVLCDGGEPFSSKEKARKYIYKQLLSYEKKGWLSALGARRDKRYQITNDFKLLTTKPKPLKTRKTEADFTTIQASDTSITVLEKEKKQHEGELAITLGEIEEYKSLLMRFPNSKQDMLPLFNGARERSAKLLGRINALTNWIKVIQGNDQKC
ncbi:hypothetical protein NDJ22_19835 [Vibrio alginolyticus]|uniref:hypothetical protein n=1 Tax=Vibrio alginolyticus TaxID=663 RepID=UPI00216090C2|nr:hypothetical protein [Vibrio alginolyticus]MCS0267269.1 hypothetical protein [Vibrio alginolyticus]